MKTISTIALLDAAWRLMPAPARLARRSRRADAILKTYADIALAGYEDALTTAKALDAAIDALIAGADRTRRWRRRGTPGSRRGRRYQQTEAFRFGNAIVDEWEGKVNAWPLDEGLIDYVDASYGTESDENGLYTANVIANPKLTIDGAGGRRDRDHAGVPRRTRCRKRAASRAMWRPAITPSSSCCGGRT